MPQHWLTHRGPDPSFSSRIRKSTLAPFTPSYTILHKNVELAVTLAPPASERAVSPGLNRSIPAADQAVRGQAPGSRTCARLRAGGPQSRFGLHRSGGGGVIVSWMFESFAVGGARRKANRQVDGPNETLRRGSLCC